ncbi:MAG: CpsD/CapB family tyrosine-protein kinase [bacterium]|nr:CpsD/CapB family tyrosine-protein kinase [bacterium]
MIYPTNAGRKQLPVEEALTSVRPIFHALLARFTQATEDEQHHRVMFVSPEHGDGTTTLAASTALMLVRHFRRDVALVEANLYTPAMASYLDIPPGPGLLDVADGTAEPEAAVRNSKLHGLYVLTAGGERRPTEGDLVGDELRGLITKASEEHRYTIIDAPPILEHPETCSLLEHVDEVLLVVRAGSTRAKRAKAAVRIIEDAGVQFGGVFLNRYKPDMPFGLGKRVPG